MQWMTSWTMHAQEYNPTAHELEIHLDQRSSLEALPEDRAIPQLTLHVSPYNYMISSSLRFVSRMSLERC